MLSALKPALASRGPCFIVMAVCFLSPCISVSQRPTMSCPGVQVGQEGRNITCVTGADARSISLSRNAETLVQCNTTTCSGEQGYRGLLTVNDTNLILSMTIESVQRKHESVLTCNVDFGEESKEVETCLLFIFVPPEKPVCNHTFNESYALITCSTAKVYPKATCQWDATSVPKVWSGSYSQQVSKDSVFTYNTTCTAVFPVTNQTEYTLHVSIYPAGIKDVDISGGAAVETKDIVITVAPPEGLPAIIVSPNQEQYNELDNVTISCTVHGGSPPVYRTSLECDREVIDTGSGSSNVTVQGQVLQMNIQLNDKMHGKSCTCSGSHVSLNYQLKNTLKFWGRDNFEDSNEPQRNNSSHGPRPLRKYTLHITSEHTEPPVCPKNLKVTLTSPDTVSLSWKYDSHDGLQQTFTIFRHDESTRGSLDIRTKVAEVNETKGDDIMEYNITGLSNQTRYGFSLDVRNSAGEKACPDVSVNVTNGAGEDTILPISRSGPSAVLLIISIACPLLAIIIVIIFIIVWRRRGGCTKGKGDKAETAENIYNNQQEMVNLNGPKSISGPTAQSTSDWPKNGTNEAGDDNVVYANTIQSSSPALSEPKTSPEPNTNVVKGNEKSARTLSPEGLAYVSVEISAATKKLVIKEQKEPKQPQADQVEYTSIDHLATSESNPVVDDGQE